MSREPPTIFVSPVISGALPLALQVIAVIIGVKSEAPLEDLVAELSDETNRLSAPRGRDRGRRLQRLDMRLYQVREG